MMEISNKAKNSVTKNDGLHYNFCRSCNIFFSYSSSCLWKKVDKKISSENQFVSGADRRIFRRT